MKPDKVTCNNCGKPIPKGKWCSDKCRMAFKRTQLGEQPEQITNPNTNKGEQILPEQPNPNKPEQLGEHEQLRAKLNKTDRTFFDRAIRDFKEPYYRFELDKLREGKCVHCGDSYKTTLPLNKYCSYQHYAEAWDKA